MDIKKKYKPFKKLPVSISLEQIFIVITVIFSLIALFSTYQCVMRFVKVGDIVIKGVHPYDEFEIVEATEIGDDEFLYNIDTKDVEKKLIADLQYLSDAKVSRQFPNKIVINVESRTPRWYVDIGGTKYTMDGELYIIQEEDTIDEGIAKLVLPNLHTAIYRKVPSFGQSENETVKILKIIDTVRNSALWGRIDLLDVEDPTNIRMEIDGKYKINLGEGKSLAGALDTISAMTETEQIKNSSGGTFEASSYGATGQIGFH